MILYKLTFESGKSYVGQTSRDLGTRLGAHRNAALAGSALAVHCAWRKHGEPIVEVLSAHETMDELHAAEIAAIQSCGTLSPGGYNLGLGGETAPSKNPDVAAKIAAKARGRKVSVDRKAAMSAATKRRWEDPEYRESLAATLATTWTPERRAAAAERARQRFTGHTASDETRAKISAANINPSADTRAKMSASAKARGVQHAFTPETCVKISAHVTASWQDPDILAKRSAAIREGHQRRREAIARGEIKPHVRTPEHAAAISAALQRRKAGASA